MNIRGLYKTSFIDFPGRISSVIFTGGCNLECGYCHNFDLALNSRDLKMFTSGEIIDFLRSRRNKIDGVTISGGEPTLSDGLIPFLESIRNIPLEIKIDTNGLRPHIIGEIVKNRLADYIAIDIKTSPAKYKLLTKRDIDFSKIIETVDIVRDSSLDYELRTTCIPGFASREDFEEIKRFLGRVRKYYLQQFIVNVPLMDKKMEGLSPLPPETLEKLKEFIMTFSDLCEVRGI